MKLIIANIIGCTLFLLIGIWFLINSLYLPESQGTGDVGPSMFPLLSSIGLIVTSIIFIGREVLKNKTNAYEIIRINNQARVLISMTILITYIISIQYISYYISSIIFIPIFLLITGVKNFLHIVSVSAGFILFIYIAFDTLLGIPLP